jgi:alkanesulfonate monooxygenase SsuD/methylene tetrahydromethanopterin reductase-like flavin-dependent oxidoreductase (luciferase family)
MTATKLGVTLPQFSGDPERFAEGAHAAEDHGLDSVWVFDHLWPLTGGKERPAYDGWTSLAWLATETSRIEIGTLVTRSSLRHPAVLGKMAATVGHIAQGRVTVAIGSGDEKSRAENEFFGIPYFEADDRIDQLRSTVETVLNYLHRERFSLTDDFVSVKDLPVSPDASPPPSVWIGGRSDDTLEIAAALADGWNGWAGTPERFAQDAGNVLEMAGERQLELSWGGLLVLRATDAEAEAALEGRSARGMIVGGPATVARKLRGYVEAGARHLILTFVGRWEPEQVRLLAEEVRPRLS